MKCVRKLLRTCLISFQEHLLEWSCMRCVMVGILLQKYLSRTGQVVNMYKHTKNCIFHCPNYVNKTWMFRAAKDPCREFS